MGIFPDASDLLPSCLRICFTASITPRDMLIIQCKCGAGGIMWKRHLRDPEELSFYVEHALLHLPPRPQSELLLLAMCQLTQKTFAQLAQDRFFGSGPALDTALSGKTKWLTRQRRRRR